MPDIIFDIDENYNPMEDLRRAEGKDKKRLAELYREIGYLKPDPNRGVFTEIGHTFMDTNNQLGLSFGRTIEELTGNPNMRERYERKIELDPQYGADEFYSPSSLKPSHVARTVTSGAVQSLGAVGAGMFGNLVGGPAGGLAAAGAVTFGQIYGDTVKEYRDAMPGEDESVVKGLAFTSAVGQSMLETIIGPEKMIAGFGKSFFSGALKETTKSLARRIGAEAAKGAVSEGAEEVLQDFWNRICKGVAAKEGFQPPAWEEVRDQFMGGALPGAVLGGVAGVRAERTGTDVNGVVRNGTENAGTEVPGGASEGGAGPIEGSPSTEAPIPVSEDAIIRGGGQTAAEAFYDEIGIKHSRMTPEEQNTEGIGYVMQDGQKRIANGLFDRNTNEIKINPTNEGEMFTHGHELDHWLEKNHPDLARQLHVIMDSELNAAGLAENQSPIERRADMLGYLFEDPKTLKRTVEIGEANQAGFGEKFLNAVIEFSKQVMAFMKGHADLPGAEKYFNNYKKVRNTAAQILAELKSRNNAEQEKIKAETPELELAGTANNTPNTPNRQGADGNVSGGAVRTVRTPDGSMEVPARFKVIPIEAAIHSGKAEYDQRFQPRNRDTKSSEAQIQKMSGEIHPEMLLDSPTTDTGAPIVDGKNQVISGNGRVMALLRAREQNIQDYYAAVRQFAAENGIEIPADLKNPLLVREVGDTDLVKLAELSNRDNKLRRTDAEQAEADAKSIMDSNLLDIFNPSDDGTIITGQNMDFLREFIQRTGDDSLRDSEGRVASGAEQRVRRAVLAAMFQGRKNARTLIQNLIENATTDGLKRQVDGVTAAVGRIMKLTAREGYQGYDLREDLARAFEALLEYKRELQINSKRYNSIGDYLDQGDIFGRNLSPNAELLARFLGNAKSIRQIRDVLNDYADHVERIDIHTEDMFGSKDEGKDSLLKRLLPGEETQTGTDENGSVRSGTENAETKAETRDQEDTGRPAVRSSSSEGRFNQDSETPFLTPEEDANDFQLTDQTRQEAAKRDQAIEKAEADKLERAKEEARRNAPELPLFGDEAPQSGMKRPAGREALPERQHNAESKTEKKDPYAAIRATREGSPERVKAFMELPDGDHELGGIKFTKQGYSFQREGQKLSARGIEQSFRGVDISKKEKSDVSDRSDTSDKNGIQTETQDNPDTQGEVPKNYKEFDENGNWKITGEKNLGQLLDEFIAALKNKKCLKVITPKGNFHLEEFNGKFCYIDPDGRIRIWEEKNVRSVLDRFIVSNNPKIRIVEESSTDAYKARKIQQDGSLLKPGDYAVFKHNGVFYEGDVASLGQKKVKLKTQSKMYGEQVISLPRESYLAHYAQSPFTLEGTALEEFNREYGSPEEYDNAKKSFMVQSAMRKEKPAREITSAAGKRADARTKRDVENFVGDGKQYSLQDRDAKIRENAKQRIKELWDSDELKSGKDENIPLGHFSPQVIEVLRNEFGLNRINDQSQLNLKLTELHHIKLHHGELTADQAAGLVDVFYAPDWIGYSSGDRKGNVLRFLQENDSGDNIGVSIYGGKNNIGYVKTFYVADSKDTLEKWKKSGIRLGPVANSDYQLEKSSRPGANPALIGPSTMPVDGKINSNPAEVKSGSEKNPEKSLSDQSDQSDQSDKIYSLQNIWTGSAADYDKPSLHYVGTGEGAQAYGWGLYGSSSRGVGEGYAEADAARKQSADVLYDGLPSDRFFRHFRWKLRNNGEDYLKSREYQQLSALHDILKDKNGDVDRVIEICQKEVKYAEAHGRSEAADINRYRIQLLEKYRDRIKWWPGSEQKIKFNGETLFDNSDDPTPAITKKIADMIKNTHPDQEFNDRFFDDSVYAALQDIRATMLRRGDNDFYEAATDSANLELNFSGNSVATKIKGAITDLAAQNMFSIEGKSSPRNLYKQTFWPGKQENLLDWNKKVPQNQMAQIREGLRKSDTSDLSDWSDSSVFTDASGQQLYNQLVTLLGSPKAASEFLYRAGIDGVTYIGDSSGVRNYVAFSDQDIQVDDHIQYSLRKHQQVNPIVVNGQVQAEYADLLDNREYTPETIEQWDQRAIAWIDRQGGIEQAAEQIANDTEHSDRHVATLVRRHVLNSEFAASLPDEIRMAVELKNISEGTAWGREGAARRLAALTLKSIDSVKALFRKLHENMPDKEKVNLRNKILDQTGVDINNLPPDLVNNKSKLDEVLRAELANTSKWHDKAYEYWINAILSAPTTHSANVIGNTANTLYELGPKRFAEAAINTLAKRRDAATFGEFREMWNALDFRSAWKKAMTAFDLETLTPGGKFRENATVAIPGKLGRKVRTPGRLLVMADAFARELLIPAETAARAYREAKNQGLTGGKLRSYIQQQMSNPGSTAYRAGKASAEQIIFQEDPGAVLQRLIALKASDGPGAQILKYLLPFVKTPGNILRQGIRKSPLGSLNLAWETVQAVRGKRAFDSEYLGHAAEQLIAWAAFLALGGFGDDDDDARPFLTGSSAPSGSGENKFKANTVPPYSIRIGDTYYSYRRIEPLATGLAIIADAMQAIREVRNGKDTAKALNDMLRKTGKMISEKSYLDSINQAVRFLEDPDRSLATFGTNFIASWVPNGLRAVLNAGKDEVEDSKSRERGEEFLQDQLQVITSRMGFTSRAPKLDLFGHPITKEQQEDPDVTDFLWRVLVPVNRTAIDEDHPGKRLLLNYNASHPENQWWGSIPNYRFTHNKERYYFNNETYHQFAAEAGKLAEKQIFNAVRHGVIHPDNPTEKDIEVMKKIFARARKETRAKFFKKAKKW